MKLYEVIHVCLVRDTMTDAIWKKSQACICEYLAIDINNNM